MSGLYILQTSPELLTMTIGRKNFFLILFFLITTPFVIHKLWWLASTKKATATMCFVGKSITGQLEHVYSVFEFYKGNDTIFFNGPDNFIFTQGQKLPVLYHDDDPENAKLDMFLPLWLDTLVYAGIPALILFIVFIHPDVVPYRSKVRISQRKPFVEII